MRKWKKNTKKYKNYVTVLYTLCKILKQLQLDDSFYIDVDIRQ